MNRTIRGLAVLALLLAGTVVTAATDWSTQDYDLYPGDFNGDGKTDLLYIARERRVPGLPYRTYGLDRFVV